jgi:hypothetical protein
VAEGVVASRATAGVAGATGRTATATPPSAAQPAPSPPRRAAAAATAGAARSSGETPVRRYRAERRSPARATLLIVGGLVVGIAVIVAIVLSLGGGGKGGSSSSSSSASGTGAATQTSSGKTTTQHAGSGASTATTSPAQLNVAVLNGTTTTGLAHHVSEELQQHGYSKATALEGQPPGSNQVTTVEYTSGHQADAQRVARSLGAAQAQPIEGTVASMASSAAVVVIVGLDKAATTP